MSARNLPGGKGPPARNADNLTAICEPIVWKMSEPRRLTNLWGFTAYYIDRFTILLPYNSVYKFPGIGECVEELRAKAVTHTHTHTHTHCKMELLQKYTQPHMSNTACFQSRSLNGNCPVTLISSS
jgi:hypothetical protein